MKPLILSTARLSFPLATALVALFAAQPASALTYYWDSDGTGTPGFGSTAGTWGSSVFWSTDATGANVGPPTVTATTTTSDTVNFGTGTLDYANAAVAVAGGGVSVNKIVFGAGQATDLTLSGGAIALGGTTPSITVNSAGHTINSALTLSAATSISMGNTAATSFTLGGGIGGTGNVTFTTANANFSNAATTITLATTGSTYDGTTLITTANLNNNLTVKAGVDNALPTATVLTLNGGEGGGLGRTVAYDLAGFDQTLGGLTNTTGLAGIRNQRILNSTATAATLTINDGSDRAFSGQIQGTNFSVTKSGAGTWTVTGANTYTGKTRINAGILSINTIADVSAASSSLGAPTTTANGLINIGNANTGGTLIYTGAVQSTDRTIQIGTNSAIPANTDTGGATIQASGASNAALTFSAATFNTQTDASGGVGANRTLVLQGSSTGNNTIAGIIQNNLIGTGSGTARVALIKQNVGTWVLGGANTFTGGLTIRTGTLIATTSSSALGGSGTGAVTLGNTTLTNAASLLVGTTGLTYANPITLATNATVGTLTIGNSGDIAATTFSGGVTGNNAFTINNSSATAAARTVRFQTADIAVNGRITNIGTSTGATTISSTITSANAVGVTQNSSGSLTLSGVGNAYSGTTIIAAGALNANSASALGTSTVDMTGASTTLSFGTGTGSVTTFDNPINVTNTATGTSLIYANTSKVSLNAPITLAANTTIQGAGTANQIGTTTLGTITSANNSNLEIFVNNNQTHVFDGAISLGTGSITRTAGSTANLTLSNASNSFSGGLNIGSIGDGTGSAASGATTITALGAQGSGDITFITGNTAPITFSNVSGTVANNIVSTGGSGGLIKAGASTMTITGTNNYTGVTRINNGGGTLRITQTGALGAGDVSILTQGTNTGTLELALTGTNSFTNNVTTSSANNLTTVDAKAHILNTSGDNTISGTITTTATGGNGTNIVSDGGLLTLSGTITHTIVSSRTLSLGGSGDGVVSGAIINNSTGDVALALNKSGAGTWTLSNASNTYTGVTTVTAGTLVLAENGAAGTSAGGITISGNSAATLQINAGKTTGDNITFSNTNAASRVNRVVAAYDDLGTPTSNDNYTTGTSGILKSNFTTIVPENDLYADTRAQILAGTNSANTERTLEMLFSSTSGATNDGIRRSDVFGTAGTSTDTYVIQLSTTSALAADSVLGWLNGGNEWVNAVSGNTGGVANFVTGAFADLTTHPLGSYGYNSGNVWAVVNHGGSFAAVPEPTSALAGLLLGAGLLRRRRK